VLALLELLAKTQVVLVTAQVVVLDKALLLQRNLLVEMEYLAVAVAAIVEAVMDLSVVEALVVLLL
jgi:hypothetical protein